MKAKNFNETPNMRNVFGRGLNGDSSNKDDIPDSGSDAVKINDQADPTKYPPEEFPPGEPNIPEPPREAPLPDSPTEIQPIKRILPNEIPASMSDIQTYL